MSLKEKIQNDMKGAMRAKEELRLSVLRMLSAAIHNKEIEKRAHPVRNHPDQSRGAVPQAEQISNGAREEELNDEETIAVLRSELKKRRDAMVEFEKGGRKDLAEKESAESKILEAYLPAELPEEELEKIVREVVSGLGEVTPKDFGRVMGEVMRRVKGQASGDRVSQAVKKAIGA